MKFQMTNIFMSVVIAAAFFPGGSARAARVPRIELLREVSVAGARLLLSDLLPEGAPGSLRARATEISLGIAPQLGNTRTLERDAMMNRISVSPDILSEITVPDRVMVSREARPITASEVLGAIRKALEHSGVRAAQTLRPEDILFQSRVFVSPGDAGLQVMRMEFDAGLRRARFLLWPSLDPTVLPFFVTARLDGDLLPAAVHGAEPGQSLSRPGISPAPKPLAAQEILVSPGERATLLLRSATLQMFADVAPLERGALGQQIRVRVLDTGKIFNARVDGRAHLEVKF
jgi:hypothetical protein